MHLLEREEKPTIRLSTNFSVSRKNWETEMHLVSYIRMALTYIPSNHGGSLKSSMENRALSSEEETNFKRGADGVFENFLATGNITCIHSKIPA